MNIFSTEDKYQLPTYAKFAIELERGQGAYVWDQTGKKYLDFYGGHAVATIGHCHPEIIKAVSAQMKSLIFYSNAVYNAKRAIAAKQLVKFAGKAFSNVFFCNSGTEANETAIKLAKQYTGKDEVISFEGSFHGRTIGSLSVTGDSTRKKYPGSLMPNVKFATFGDINSVKQLVSQNSAAIILEPIQSIGGVNEATPNFYKQLGELAKQAKTMLIFDEIQTGLGRTGKRFFYEFVGVVPDIMTLAKGLAGGFPAGAVLVNKYIAQSVKNGDQGSTFGGGPVICSAISATLNVIQKENLAKNAARSGKILKEQISKINHVICVKGKGLLLGIVFDIPAIEIQRMLLKAGVITGTSSDQYTLRLMPPLTITDQEIELFIKMLKKVIKEIHG